MMRAALAVEWLKLRHSRMSWIVFALVGVGCPALTAGFLYAATNGPPNAPLAIKVNAMLIGQGWLAYLGMLTQILSVAAIFGPGVVVSWCFGREFTDQTLTGLFALPTSRMTIAAAKFIVLIGWSVALSCVALAAAFALTPIAGVHPTIDGTAVASAKLILVAMSGGILALPLAFIGTVGRGYLPAITSLILIVVITQIITVVGAGGWFPYATASLWAGMGGPAAASLIQPIQLALIPTTGLVGVAATLHRWHRLQIT
jgi:ABC-2 type transport system permease protein